MNKSRKINIKPKIYPRTNDSDENICCKAIYNDRLDKELTSDSDDISTCSSSTNSTISRKNVSFSNLEVKYFAYDLGDSHRVKDGPPLTITWDSFKAIVIPIEKYESVREPRGPVPIINPKERMNILLRIGIDASQIEDTMEEIRRTREEEEEQERLLDSRATKAKRKMMNYVKKINVRCFGTKKWHRSGDVLQQ